jgi:Pyruvate/2-oxoacid:ferredoxin oxidoreductase gamma subunit
MASAIFWSYAIMLMCVALSYLLQRPVPRVIEARPIPTSTFISDAQARMTAPDPRANTVMQGTLAQKFLAMQKEKNKAIEDQKIAVLEAKYAAQVKKAEEQAHNKLELEKKKTELAQERARDGTWCFGS